MSGFRNYPTMLSALLKDTSISQELRDSFSKLDPVSEQDRNLIVFYFNIFGMPPRFRGNVGKDYNRRYTK